ncbi:Flagellar basal-body rod protein FlgG [Aquimixticola soesokkakensis]|uniref:Flagellar basal-body rod protein FlgF n=1 Tax=Aquimixticola soesokkakensis TaxID=1519096 RepID=A0A1Y5RA04_9RHOB|nr:flagellar hook-basal body complex protein [Aquimixticola soesokkakensis]SLN12578.1 Flagellar basal-body rod protein FlgG [Aquimixticola soesokkakensis]
MDSAGYASLTRMSGLKNEMTAIANNIANMSTTGFRREGMIFSEFIAALEPDEASLSMATADVRLTDDSQGPLTATGGTFDFAIEGDGFFQIDTPNGPSLTRGGAFTPNEEGELVTLDGYRLLDNGGTPIFIPTNATGVSMAADGTLSADGLPLAQVGLFLPTDPTSMNRADGVRFQTEGGIEPYEDGKILQGFVEGSNVNAVSEISRMIQVQRAYEMGQNFLDKEDERIRSVLSTLGR